MEILTLVLAFFAGFAFLNSLDQKKRIELLRKHLGPYQIDVMLEKLAEGYERALAEQDPERREQIWGVLEGAERSIAKQFTRFVHFFVDVDANATRVSTLPFALPWAHRWCHRATFDLRAAFMVHAYAITEAVDNNAKRPPRDKAYLILAELFLMQHTCHWFCRSFSTASARMVRSHKTGYRQVLAAVSPYTRRAYGELTGL